MCKKIGLPQSTFAAALVGMDKKKPIVPNVPVRENLRDFPAGKDFFYYC